MTLRAAIVVSGLMMFAAAESAAAQNVIQQPGGPPMPAPVRIQQHIEIHPGRLLYRRCTDMYELQYRPSGTVLYPGKHCWWVRG